MWATIIACVVVFCASLPYAQFENKTMTISGMSPISVERITELYLTIVGLIERFDRDEMPHYSKFFNAALMRKARDVFGEVYGYAHNETQGIAWEANVIDFFRLYVIHTSLAYANAQYEYHTEFIDKKIGEPCPLRVQCIAQIRRQIKSHLGSDFYYFKNEDYMLGYLLTRFTEMQIFVTAINSPPFIVINLNEYYNRFIDETSPAAYPIPYSPDENFVYEIELFWRAQLNVFDLLSGCLSDSLMQEFADAGVNAHIKQFLKNFSSTDAKPCCVRRFALLLHTFNFLESEYRRLVCHPAYKTNWINEERKTAISNQQNRLRVFYETTIIASCLDKCNTIKCSPLKLLYESLKRMQTIVGYSVWRRTGIAIVEKRRARQS